MRLILHARGELWRGIRRASGRRLQGSSGRFEVGRGPEGGGHKAKHLKMRITCIGKGFTRTVRLNGTRRRPTPKAQGVVLIGWRTTTRRGNRAARFKSQAGSLLPADVLPGSIRKGRDRPDNDRGLLHFRGRHTASGRRSRRPSNRPSIRSYAHPTAAGRRGPVAVCAALPPFIRPLIQAPIRQHIPRHADAT